MFKLFTLVAIVAALVLASTASAHHSPSASPHTYCVDNSTVTVDGGFIESLIGSAVVENGGYYSYDVSIGKFTLGPFYSLSEPWVLFGEPINVVFHTVTAGECPVVPVEPVANRTNETFACYSHFEVVPAENTVGYFEDAIASGAWTTAFLPVAVPGNVAFGTNVGGNHLVCNYTGDLVGYASNTGTITEGIYSHGVAESALAGDHLPYNYYRLGVAG